MEENNNLEKLERKLKLITVLLVCTLVVSALALVFQFAPVPGRMMAGGDFRTSGQFPPGYTQQQDGAQNQNGAPPAR